MSELLYHNCPNTHFFIYFSGSCMVGVQKGEVWTDAMGRRELLLPYSWCHQWNTPGPFSQPLTHFSLDGSWTVTYMTSNFGLKLRSVWHCLILPDPSLPSGSISSAWPLHAGYSSEQTPMWRRHLWVQMSRPRV